MTGYEFGDLVLVPFPFLTLKTSKRRPALVLGGIRPAKLPSFSLLAMVTSQVEGEHLPGDYLLGHWRESNLLHPSKVRLSKVVSVEDTLVIKKVGALQKEDLACCRDAFKDAFPDLFR